MKKTILLLIFSCGLILAECPLDHLIIGCNADGVQGTADDDKLFFDCRQKYRNSGSSQYQRWFYPLSTSIFSSYKYRLGEPGFDIFQDTDPSAAYTYFPEFALSGDPNTDYNLIIECVSISPGMRVVHKESPQFTIDAAGENFNYSEIHAARNDGHIHLSYQAEDNSNLKWLSWRVYDNLQDGSTYQASEAVTIVFNEKSLAGDLQIDGTVDQSDLLRLGFYWLSTCADNTNDYFERADADKSGSVNFTDFSLFAANWLLQTD